MANQVEVLDRPAPLETGYGLDRCQIDTPDNVVDGFWKVLKRHRQAIGDVVDLGAGDGRFAFGGSYRLYHGYEIDRTRLPVGSLPNSANVFHKCAFEIEREDYDVCVGNPPYVRHHDIEAGWREELVQRIKRDFGVEANRLSNLFVYFMCLGLSKTKDDGLVALLIPFEWVSRPSTRPLRELIGKKRWDVHVYRFRDAVFKGVLTTASISVIDKAGHSGRWRYYDLTPDFVIAPKRQASGSIHRVLAYQRREEVWALRGLSPGSQDFFTLTDKEMASAGLKNSDVAPCVTSLRNLPAHVSRLTERAFKKYFVDANRKCWLIRTDGTLSHRLRKYIKTVSPAVRQNYTCRERTPWFKYKPHPAPRIFYGSGFTSFGPKFVVNEIGAAAVGSVYGIHSSCRLNASRMRQRLAVVDFEGRVVSHAKTLKKVEIGQMNSMLKTLLTEGLPRSRKG